MKIGYIRVSSITQNTERQLANIELEKVFEEKLSAKDTNRPILNECLKFCRDGDELHIHSIDRLARNLKDLQEIVEKLLSKNVSVHFHKENLVFDNQQSPINKLMFQMLGAFSEFERSLIKERQLEGIAIAKANGKYKKVGRSKALTDSEAINAYELSNRYDSTIVSIAKRYNTSRSSIYRAIERAKELMAEKAKKSKDDRNLEIDIG